MTELAHNGDTRTHHTATMRPQHDRRCPAYTRRCRTRASVQRHTTPHIPCGTDNQRHTIHIHNNPHGIYKVHPNTASARVSDTTPTLYSRHTE